MPELPEVEVIVKGLNKNILNLKILDFKIINKNLRYPLSKDMEATFKNKTVKHILRRGKYGIIVFDGSQHIIFHLGMTGKFKLLKKKKDSNLHDHILIQFNNGLNLIYNDVRKFGFFLVYSNHIDLYNFKKLGEEPNFLSHLKEELWKNFKLKKKNVKSILLDQSFIAGIGNIYASEILFDCKLNPYIHGTNFDKKSFYRLLKSTETVLKKAILKGGVSIKDYRNIEGELGYFQIDLKVYGREGLACYKCKNLITKDRIAGRSTFYCKNCQKY